MKRLLVLFTILTGYAGYAQETLSPLGANPRLYYSSPQYQSKHNGHGLKAQEIVQKGTLLIESDTLSLPFIDDFSYNTLKPLHYDQYIYDTIYRAYGPCDSFMSVATDTGSFSLVQSYTYTFDSATYYLDSVPTQPIVFHYYPQVGTDCFSFLSDSITVYPLWYHPVYDSSGFMISQGLDSFAVANDTFLTFAPILYKSKMPAYVKWLDNFAFYNTTYPYLPPSIGVATLDGLNDQGQPYTPGNINAQGYADTLTSKPLDLSPYSDGDSVYLSFFYQARGYGDWPNTGDSLFLEFHNGYTSGWDKIWGVDGFAIAPNWPDTFHQVLIRIPSTILPYQEYFFNGFQFRFRNIASTSGNNDHWHIDYVRLAKNRSVTDTAIDDIAYQYEIPSILKNYSEMPAWQYTGNSDLADSVTLYVDNLDPSQAQNNPPATSYSIVSSEVYPTPQTTYMVTSSFNAATEDSIILSPSTQYTVSAAPFDSLVIKTQATINVPNYLTANDTISGTQTLTNTLAYDDGTAERAWGLRNLYLKKLGYEFILNQPDTIIGYQILFTHIDYDVSDLVFVYNIWDSIQLNNPYFVDSAIYTSNNVTPLYVDSVSGYATYKIDPFPVPTKFYFGLSYTDTRDIQIGYDVNSTKGFSHIYIYTNGTWQTTGVQTPGSICIRLLMRHSSQIATGVKEVATATIKAYPNPTTGVVHFDLPDAQSTYTVELYNTLGQLSYSQAPDQNNSINIQRLSPGIYMLRVTDTKSGVVYQNKLLKAANQ